MKWRKARIGAVLSGLGEMLGLFWELSRSFPKLSTATECSRSAMSSTDGTVYEMPRGPEKSEALRDQYFTEKMTQVFDALERTLHEPVRSYVGRSNRV